MKLSSRWYDRTPLVATVRCDTGVVRYGADSSVAPWCLSRSNMCDPESAEDSAFAQVCSILVSC